MNILAPVNNFEAAIELISAGADEIYLGADEELFSTYSFTGRGKISNSQLKILNSFVHSKEIIEYAHSKNVKVNFLGNTQFFYDGKLNHTSMENYFLNYIENAIKIGADSIVIGDIGLLKLVSDRKYNVKLHASVYFRTINIQQLLFLKELGVTRTTLSYHITLDEIAEMTPKDIMDIEVIGYLGCSFYNGACGFLHDYGEGVFNDFDPGVACKGIYDVYDGVSVKTGKLFDSEAGCSICELGELNRLGVTALKIVGRGRGHKQISEVIRLYKSFLQQYSDGLLYQHIKSAIPTWWYKLWCSKKSCKYKKDNPNYMYTIGR